jgi:hypothetical protein
VNKWSSYGIDNSRATVSNLQTDGRCTLSLLENSENFGNIIQARKNPYDVGTGSVRKNNGTTSLKLEGNSHMQIGLAFAQSSTSKAMHIG